MNAQSSFGEVIATALYAVRSALGWSQQQMAAELGVVRNTVWRLETGRQYPSSPPVVEKVAALTQLSAAVINANRPRRSRRPPTNVGE